MLADELDFVIGVDTHRDAHSLALVQAASGGLLCEAEIAATAAGYAQALAFGRAQAPGRRAFAIEGSGSYGAGLARFLAAHGERVLEVGRPARGSRRGGGKSDALDALRAARSALAAETQASPRGGRSREALRALVTTREGAVQARRAGLNQLRALVVSCPEPLRAELRGLSEAKLLERCLTLGSRPDPAERHGTLVALAAVSRRVRCTSAEARELKREIETLVRALAPALLAEPGVGPICAAQLLISWSHRGRIHSEAAFARIAAAAPIPASSGQVVRHRLDRGGDRQLNRALQTIILSRRRQHAPTITYIQRRLHEGKTTREATRCLKRYLARHLFRLLEALPLPA